MNENLCDTGNRRPMSAILGSRAGVMTRWKLFTAGPRLIEASQEGNIEETTQAQEEEMQ